VAVSMAFASAGAGSSAGWGTSSGDTRSTVMASGDPGGKALPPANITTGVTKARWAMHDMARPAGTMSFRLPAGPPFSVSFPAFSLPGPGKGRKRRSERPFTPFSGNACLPDFAKAAISVSLSGSDAAANRVTSMQAEWLDFGHWQSWRAVRMFLRSLRRVRPPRFPLA